MTVLALDLATVTGWACACGTVTSHGHVKFRPSSRFTDFARWLHDLLAGVAADHVVYESPQHFRSRAANRVAYGLAAITEAVAGDERVSFSMVNPSTLKKWATGDGRADKPAMVLAAARLWPGEKVIDHNEADAMCLAAHYLSDPARRIHAGVSVGEGEEADTDAGDHTGQSRVRNRRARARRVPGRPRTA